MTARPNNTERAVAMITNVATVRARRREFTATQVAANTLPPMAICPTSGTEKVSVAMVTTVAHTNIAATALSNQKIVRERIHPWPPAAEAQTHRPAKRTSTALITTLGPPRGKAVAGNQRHATTASSNARNVHASKRGKAATGSKRAVICFAFSDSDKDTSKPEGRRAAHAATIAHNTDSRRL